MKNDEKKEFQDFEIELQQDLLDCVQAMENVDVIKMVCNIDTRASFAAGVLGSKYKEIPYFLQFIVTGEKSDIPF